MNIYTSNKPTRCNRPVEFTEALRLAFRNILNFKGRARRSEYWWTAVGLYLITIVVYILAMLVGAGTAGFAALTRPDSIVVGGLFATYAIVCAWGVVAWILMLALTFRRLHDTGHSGWLIGATYLLGIVGFIFLAAGAITRGESMAITAIAVLLLAAYAVLALYIFLLTLFDSDVEENKYGPSQKYAIDEAVAAEATAGDHGEQPLGETPADEPGTTEPAEE